MYIDAPPPPLSVLQDTATQTMFPFPLVQSLDATDIEEIKSDIEKLTSDVKDLQSRLESDRAVTKKGFDAIHASLAEILRPLKERRSPPFGAIS